MTPPFEDDPRDPHRRGFNQPLPDFVGNDPQPLYLDLEIEKPWWQSRSVWGGVVAAGAGIAGALGYHFDVALTTELVTSVAGAVGGVLAIVGRIRATRPIVVPRVKR